jgi:hypothetical protein
MTKLLLIYHLRIIPESGFRFPRTTQAQWIVPLSAQDDEARRLRQALRELTNQSLATRV